MRIEAKCRNKSCEFNPHYNSGRNYYVAESSPCNNLCKKVADFGFYAKLCFWPTFIIGGYAGVLSFMANMNNFGAISAILLIISLGSFIATIAASFWPVFQKPTGQRKTI